MLEIQISLKKVQEVAAYNRQRKLTKVSQEVKQFFESGKCSELNARRESSEELAVQGMQISRSSPCT